MDFIKARNPSTNETRYAAWEKVTTIGAAGGGGNFSIICTVIGIAEAITLKDGYASLAAANDALLDLLNEHEVRELA